MILQLIFLVLSIAFALTFLILLLQGKEFDSMIEPLDDKQFPLKELYGVGFVLLKKLKFSFTSKNANAIRNDITIIYGEKYAEFYLRALYAKKITLSFFVLVIICLLAPLSGENGPAIFLLGCVLAALIYYVINNSTKKEIQKNSIMYMSDFPGAVSTIALLVNSGMTLREAWSEVAYSSDSSIFLQMQRVTEDMNNGMSEIDALYAFSLRCAVPEIKKFTAFIIQGLEKGTADLTFSLKSQSEELWEAKKQKTLQLGEAAASKLLIPIVLIFIGILLMIMGPMITSLNF